MEMDADIGTWMAPANVGYVILGLLYGEGDFKKSLLTAVNSGDDTDCTAVRQTDSILYTDSSVGKIKW